MSLRGRLRGDCHPGELGVGLRKLDLSDGEVAAADGFFATWRRVG
jgi:hypothetical protein